MGLAGTAALINAHGGAGRHVVMIGHSSGGGLTIRFAGGQHGSLLDRAVLIAPYLHHSAPTFRDSAGGWAHPLVRRIIGLSMLNGVGVTAFNGMTVIQFNYPDSILNSPQGRTAGAAAGHHSMMRSPSVPIWMVPLKCGATAACQSAAL